MCVCYHEDESFDWRFEIRLGEASAESDCALQFTILSERHCSMLTTWIWHDNVFRYFSCSTVRVYCILVVQTDSRVPSLIRNIRFEWSDSLYIIRIIYCTLELLLTRHPPRSTKHQADGSIWLFAAYNILRRFWFGYRSLQSRQANEHANTVWTTFSPSTVCKKLPN